MQYNFKYFVVFLIFTSFLGASYAQNTTNYWQQHVDYTMEVEMDVESFQYTGTQKLINTNNTNDE